MVTPGLDRLAGEGLALADLETPSRVGLVAHPASVDRRARHAIESLSSLSDCRLVRLFAPEHGLWGQEQDMEQVRTSSDPFSGLPVISLYGATPDSLAPRAEDLEELDAIVVDLQDVGSRYYTFIYTLSYVMEAAREAGLPVVVLDRPNPIGGEVVEGPVLDPALSSFVGRYALPVRHGMTVAELARLFNESFGIGCDLRVVPMTGWSRDLDFEATGLPWIPPSPNMPTISTARVYPGGCLIEGTNLSEGRGTTSPFELVGAPWLDAHALTAVLRALDLPGVLFRPSSFRPMFQKHAGTACNGVQVIVSDRTAFRAFETYLAILLAARAQDPRRFAWRDEVYEFEATRPAIDLLLGRADLRPMLESGQPLDRFEPIWRSDLDGFCELRRKFLAY